MLPEPANTMIASTTENLWGTGALEALSMAVSGYIGRPLTATGEAGTSSQLLKKNQSIYNFDNS
jgi:hypothetical protein